MRVDYVMIFSRFDTIQNNVRLTAGQMDGQTDRQMDFSTSHTRWLKIKYPTGEHAIYPQPGV